MSYSKKDRISGDTYIESIELLNKTARKITDKLPLNMLMVGLIKIALPNARIIHCTRNPIDTCLSIYKQLFTTDNYQFAYNQATLAQYHNLYRELMYHWHTVLPDSIYEISYESLTHSPESEIKKLIESYRGISKVNKLTPEEGEGIALCSQKRVARESCEFTEFDIGGLISLGYTKFKLLYSRRGGPTATGY